MTTQDDVRRMLGTAEAMAYEGETVTPLDLEIDDVDKPMAALEIFRRAKRQEQAARAVSAAAGVQLAQLIGDGGAACYGDTIARYSVSVTEKCFDPEGFAAAVTRMGVEGHLDVGKLFPPGAARKTAMPAGMRDSFFAKEYGDTPTLKLIPRDRAPKFLQGLADGEVFLKGGEDG